jgi:hypothetical protein
MRRWLAQGLVALTLSGCRSCRPEPVGPTLPTSPPPTRLEAEPAGAVEGGQFVDADGGFSVSVPEGWSARPGPRSGALRVALDDPDTGVRVEAWRFSGSALTLRPRAGCLWTFSDRGPYRDLPVPDALQVGTCMPDDPIEPRVQAWVLRRGDFTWQLEVHLPQAHMLDARRAGLAALSTARWGRVR